MLKSFQSCAIDCVPCVLLLCFLPVRLLVLVTRWRKKSYVLSGDIRIELFGSPDELQGHYFPIYWHVIRHFNWKRKRTKDK